MPPEVATLGTAVVLADGAVPSRVDLDAAWPGWDAGIDLVVAADGGARHARTLGLRIDRWVGDGDSIDAGDLAALAAAGVRVDRVAAAKDASDTELALDVAIEAGARQLVLLGALGGPRTDHALANLGLLRHPGLAGRRLVLYDEHGARLSLLEAVDEPRGASLAGRKGDTVSLLPVDGDAQGVTTEHLEYPLRDEPLLVGRTRGLSNVRAAPVASVTLRAGRLLVIETPARFRP